MKKFVVSGAILVVLILLVPTLLVVSFSNKEPVLSHSSQEGNMLKETTEEEGADVQQPIVSVFRSEQETIEEVPFEEYIVGVVAREMPATFQLEALKAQALTARTYILNLLLFGGDIKTPEGADVTDTVDHQVYFNDEDLQEHWGDDYEWKIARVRQAVYETKGDIITYDGRPITATFFSTSNGYTENSEEYWENEIPYLRSVESAWDTASPRYQSKKELTVEEVENELNVSLEKGAVEVLSRTTGGRVETVSIGGKELTGRQVREKLDLDSSDFTFHIAGDTVTVETFGWGHGVGMSQYGADGMAQEGYDYTQIISHYYDNVDIMKADQFLGEISFAKDKVMNEYSMLEKQKLLASEKDLSSTRRKYNE